MVKYEWLIQIFGSTSTLVVQIAFKSYETSNAIWKSRT
jgi:hypothetical protein